MSAEPLRRAAKAARDLDRAYRDWRHAEGFTGPAEVAALGYVTYLDSVRLRHHTRVLFGLPADEADALARFLAANTGPGDV